MRRIARDTAVGAKKSTVEVADIKGGALHLRQQGLINVELMTT